MSHILIIVSSYFTDVQNSVTFNGTLKPIAHIRSLMLRHICVFSNPLYFDSLVGQTSVICSAAGYFRVSLFVVVDT